MTNPTDSKTLNAIRLHLILLNEGSEAVHFKLIEIIRQRDLTNNPNCVKKFLNRHKRNSSHFLDGFRRTLIDKYSNNHTLFPNDLNDFDMTACYSIARTLLNLQGNDLKTI